MSYSDLLISTGDISRFSDGAPDSYGNPVKTWNVIATGTPCRLSDSGGKELTQGIKIVIADYRLFLGDVDVTEQDRVTILSKVYEVLLVCDMQDATGDHHKECLVFTVR